MRTNPAVGTQGQRNTLTTYSHTLHEAIMLLLHAALNQGTRMHANTRANPSHTLPLCVCSAVDWIENVLQLFLLLLGATLSDAACEGRRIQTGSRRSWRVKSERRGAHSCHTELLCQAMAPCEACHLSDWWGGWGWGEGKCACGWGCTREKEYGCCWSPLAYLFIHAHQYCAHMQIYKHSGINQTRKKKKITFFPSGRLQLYAVTTTEKLLLIPPFFSFLSSFLTLPCCPISLQWTRSLSPRRRPQPFHFAPPPTLPCSNQACLIFMHNRVFP